MRYKTFMLQKYLADQSLKGKLARDIKSDKNFPNAAGKKVVREYLESQNAAPEIMDVYAETWKEFVTYVEEKRVHFS